MREMLPKRGRQIRLLSCKTHMCCIHTYAHTHTCIIPLRLFYSSLTVDPFDLHHCKARWRLTRRSDSRSTLLPISTNGKLSGSIGAACYIREQRNRVKVKRYFSGLLSRQASLSCELFNRNLFHSPLQKKKRKTKTPCGKCCVISIASPALDRSSGEREKK